MRFPPRRPNENWARELMELYCLGVDQYSQRDVEELARIFTGWRRNPDRDVAFDPLVHDAGDKVFLGHTITGREGMAGREEALEALDWILQEPQCARHLALRLLQTFAHPNPGEEVLAEFAQVLREKDFDVLACLRVLFASRWFFEPEQRLALVRTPIEQVVACAQAFGVQNVDRMDLQVASRDMGMDLLEPPSVGGWNHQADWISPKASHGRAKWAARLGAVAHAPWPVDGACAMDFDGLWRNMDGSHLLRQCLGRIGIWKAESEWLEGFEKQWQDRCGLPPKKPWGREDRRRAIRVAVENGGGFAAKRSVLTMWINRRQFLGLSGALLGTAALGKGGPEGRGSGFQRLVVLELFGGNDGLNTLAPVGDDLYHRARPYLAVSKKAGIRMDDHFSWHPRLGKLAQRYGEGGVCVVQGVGYEPANLSHFRSRDIWYTGSLEAVAPDRSWLGRLADSVWGPDRSPVSLLNVGRNLAPTALRSSVGNAFAMHGPVAPMAAVGPGPSMGDDSTLERELRQSREVAQKAVQVLSGIPKLQAKVEWPDSIPGRNLVGDLAQVVAAMDAGVETRVFWVSQPGYDTHAHQGNDHSMLLSELDGALDAFLSELEERGLLQDTLVMTLSEFGRRVSENGVRKGAGTDHGSASLQMLFGGSCVPGLHGANPNLERLDAHGNLRVDCDFRRLLASLCEGWFGTPAAPILGADFAPIPCLKGLGSK